MLRPGKPRWSFWHHYLAGISRENWRRLRAENEIDPGFRHRALYLSARTLVNEAQRRQEERRFGKALDETSVEAPPLFILGHWRSGTTYLHDLLACDTERFACPNGAQVTYPLAFLTVEDELKRRFGHLLPPTRPMDNVPMNMDTPQEDEFALCVACLRSPYPGMFSFPRRAAHYDRYLTFRDVPAAEIEEWKETFRWFARKVTLKYRRPLLMKSPTHTARICLLLELFPEARFVHIHRDPYAVFQSTRHLFRSLWPLFLLQRPPEDVDDAIFRRYTDMHDAFFEQRGLVPEGRFHEVRYDDLVRDPVGQVRILYERLDLGEFEAARPQVEAHAASTAGYQRNRFGALPPETRERVAREWRRSFETWSYPA